jgi:hypothetical protein
MNRREGERVNGEVGVRMPRPESANLQSEIRNLEWYGWKLAQEARAIYNLESGTGWLVTRAQRAGDG